MAKVVHVNGEILGITGKEWNLIDSGNNVKKFSKLFRKYNEDILEIENNPLTITDFLVGSIPNILKDMLGLTKEERKSLDDYSFSDQYEIFREMANKFLGLEMAPMEGEEVAEDPKKPEED